MSQLYNQSEVKKWFDWFVKAMSGQNQLGINFFGSPKVFPKEFNQPWILKQDKNKQINIGNSALGYLKSKLKSQITNVDMDVLQRKILISWKHYNDFYINCRNCQLYMLETDFSKPDIAAQKIHQFLSDEFVISKNALFNHLKTSMSKTYGLSFPFINNKFLILIDQNHKKSTEIMHQFTHFVQLVTGEFKIQNKPLIKNICNQFNLNEDEINYIFNQKQFWPNIYNDLFDALQKIYWKFHSNILNWEQFIDHVITQMEIKGHIQSDTLLYKEWIRLEINNVFYLNVLAAIAYADEQFFNQIIERLKNK